MSNWPARIESASDKVRTSSSVQQRSIRRAVSQRRRFLALGTTDRTLFVFWLTSAIVGIIAVVLIGISIYRAQVPASSELFLPSVAKQGNWGDPIEEAQSEEEFRSIGSKLSLREEKGPIRCSLRVCARADALHEPELEVELSNPSDQPVSIQVHRFMLDTVTFIFRDPEGDVESSFCHVNLHSDMNAGPPIILAPGESETSRISLSMASARGFRQLRPGLYSIEAVFHEPSLFDPLGPEESMLARSERIPVRVGKQGQFLEIASQSLTPTKGKATPSCRKAP